MDEARETNWQESVSAPYRDPGIFQGAISAADQLVKLMPQVLGCIVSKDMLNITNQYMKITGRGKTASIAGYLALLDVLTPDLTGPSEVRWFQSISKLCQAAMNSIAGRNLSDQSPFDKAILDAVPIQRLVVFSQLSRIHNSLNEAFPQREQAK